MASSNLRLLNLPFIRCCYFCYCIGDCFTALYYLSSIAGEAVRGSDEGFPSPFGSACEWREEGAYGANH